MTKKYPTLDSYLSAVESVALRELLRNLINLSLEVPKQILSFMKEETDYAGTINISGDQQLSLDVAAHELFIQKMPNELYYLLVGEETTPENVAKGTGEYIILGDFIDGSSIVRSRGPGGIVLVINKAGTIVGALTVSYTLFLRFDLATEVGYLQFIHDGTQFHVLKDELNISPSKKPVYGFGGKEEDYTEDQRKFVEKIKTKAKLRYGGCMVQDMNNILDKTGIFGYFAPKLRLAYEILPYLYLLSKINGSGFYMTTEGKTYSLDEAPKLEVEKLTDMKYLHRKVGFVGGSKDLVELWTK
ncbi:MAG: hypothetical protein ACTSQE_13220 [Candidatus Heimdallarchaeaceae archaeon]